MSLSEEEIQQYLPMVKVLLDRMINICKAL